MRHGAVGQFERAPELHSGGSRFEAERFHQVRRTGSTVEQPICNRQVRGSTPRFGSSRGIAQSGSALALGARGRRFESGCPDQIFR